MKTLQGLELVYRKTYLNLTKIFALRLFKIAANQGAQGLKRGLLSKLWWQRSVNHVKFTKLWGGEV